MVKKCIWHRDKIYTVNLYTVTKYRYIVTFIGSIFLYIAIIYSISVYRDYFNF